MSRRIMPKLSWMAPKFGKPRELDEHPNPNSGNTQSSREENSSNSNPPDGSMEGVLYKSTHYGCGWRRCWFSLHGGFLTYSKPIRKRKNMKPSGPELGTDGSGIEIINGNGRSRMPTAIVYLKVAGFRESKCDLRKFYIFSPTKTLQLKTFCKQDRPSWIQALTIARDRYSLKYSFIPKDIPFSTKGLRDHLQTEGFDQSLVTECEEIMLLEFSNYLKQLRIKYELEEATKINSQALERRRSRTTRGENSDGVHDTTNEIELQSFDSRDLVDEVFFDSTDRLSNSSGEMNAYTTENLINQVSPSVIRRTKLPKPSEKEKGVSLWSVIKDCVGNDMTNICLPVYFNEPLSSLQKCCEELEYSSLLDEAFEFGKMGNNLMRVIKVAAFAVASYASSEGRPCKPFNPMLGETYEAEFPEKGIRFISEKVSHHPVMIACHCDGKGWKFYGDTNLKSKFWGQSIQLDPIGTLTVEFDDGEIFTWNKVTTIINNLILGKPYCNHYGTMEIKGNRQFSCKLKFKEQSLLDRMPREVQGYVEDLMGNKCARLRGEWNDNLCYEISESKNSGELRGEKESLLWKKNEPPAEPTRYNFSSFGITLNELTSELQEKLPPTDSRLRPDQRLLENGEYDKANIEKVRLEQRQRRSKNLQENGWNPRWFKKDETEGAYRYAGGYWEAKKHKNWSGCPDIFGAVCNDNTSANE